MNDELLGFDTEFLSDDEVEQMLDSIVTGMGKLCAAEDRQTAIVKPDRVKELLYVYEVLKHLTKANKGVRVTYELYKPYKSMGCVSVIGKHPTFKNPTGFMKAVELSNNLDVYPKTDGTVQMDFTFHGLTKSVK